MLSFNGFDQKALTFKTSGTVAVGTPVKVSADSTVAAAKADEIICGVVLSNEGDAAAVQVSGTVTLPYTGTTAPAYGYQNIAANGSGGIKVGSGRQVMVLSINTANKVCTFIL